MCLTVKRPLQVVLGQLGVVVAVIKARSKGNATLLALSSVALALPGVSAKAGVPAAEPEVNVQYGYYEELGDRMEAEVFHGDFIVPVNDFLEFSFSYDWDTYVGATPSYSAPQVMADVVAAASGSDSAPYDIAFNLFLESDVVAARLAAPGNALEKIITGYEAVTKRFIPDSKPVELFNVQPRENRDMPIFGTNLYLGDVTVGLSSGVSIEPDFESTFGSINMSWDLNDKLTTLSAGYGLTLNDIIRTAGTAGGHHGGGGGGRGGIFETGNNF